MYVMNLQKIRLKEYQISIICRLKKVKVKQMSYSLKKYDETFLYKHD